MAERATGALGPAKVIAFSKLDAEAGNPANSNVIPFWSRTTDHRDSSIELAEPPQIVNFPTAAEPQWPPRQSAMMAILVAICREEGGPTLARLVAAGRLLTAPASDPAATLAELALTTDYSEPKQRDLEQLSLWFGLDPPS